jgi:predicted phosphodiesterase
MGSNRKWTQQECEDLLRLTEDEFLAAYVDRTLLGVRMKAQDLLPGESYTNFRVRQATERAEAHEARVAGQRAPGMPEELPEDPEALERLFAAYREVVAAGSELAGRPSKRLDWRPEDDAPVAVAFMSDIHAGATIDYERFEEDLRTIRDTDGLYAVINGDLTENTKPQAKSGTALYGAVFPAPGLQLAYMTTRLEWIAREPHKLLAIVEGNHDGFDGRFAGIDRLPDLARHLGAEYFTETGGSIFVHLGGQSYHLVVRHNHAGISQLNKGNSARRLYDEWPWASEHADVIALAHTHEPHLEQVMRKGEIVTYVRSGTYKVRDEWAENNGWRSAYGVPVVVLFPGDRRIVAFHGSQFGEAVDYLRMARDRAMVSVG